MSVWLTIPSKRSAAEANKVLDMWRQQGYRIAVWRDTGDGEVDADMLYTSAHYPGWPGAVNKLMLDVFASDPDCDWCVSGGDDTHPDLAHNAYEIAYDCSRFFGLLGSPNFGVMQPTGDRWGDDAFGRAKWPDAPAMIDRICGSPWIGREFAVRINQGTGPLWHEYRHNWADEELLHVARNLGVLWQRRDLIHYHAHARRDGGQWQPHQRWFDEDYVRMKPLFDARKRMGFPGHEPLAAVEVMR